MSYQVLKEAKKLGDACRDVGFFVVKNHGISATEMQDLFQLSKLFFAQTVDDKDSISIEGSLNHRGYGRIGTEQLDPTKTADFKETFDMARNLSEAHPSVLAGDSFYGPNQYPNMQGFQSVVEQYYSNITQTGLNLLAIMAVSLNLPITYFDRLFDNHTSVLRMIHYPKVDRQGCVSAGEHTDYGCLTLLAQDDSGGLQVKPRGQDWIAIPYVADTLVVNIGDLMQRWTNDVYQSTPHRVIPPLGKDRYSIPFFLEPNTKTLVECIPSCLAQDKPCHYPPIFSDEWISSKFNATYAYRK